MEGGGGGGGQRIRTGVKVGREGGGGDNHGVEERGMEGSPYSPSCDGLNLSFSLNRLVQPDLEQEGISRAGSAGQLRTCSPTRSVIISTCFSDRRRTISMSSILTSRKSLKLSLLLLFFLLS
uniref:Uncharacterized protein n=1 Tax=Guillardia theta TaxID=55529 RepID=A0A7S4PF79_GUITH|mmetsp:Transcript_48852/g.153432  ORF Transcript_48852/g.153432 Transcript_48852/m.153432 type:complete len:122 (+) Transcript_48852:451-816(+)